MSFIVITFLLLLLCIVLWRTKDARIVRVRKGEIYNFQSIFEVTGLPMITLEQNGKKFHFLVDSGCNSSVVSDNSGIAGKPIKCKHHALCGINGDNEDKSVNMMIEVTLTRDSQTYVHTFEVADLESAREAMLQSWSPKLLEVLGDGKVFAGILGGDFFDKYNWVIDYCEKIVYGRK